MEARSTAAIDALTLGQRLSLARRSAHLDQDELARQLEVSRTTLSRWERDQGEPSLSQAATVARATGWPLEWLAGLSAGSRCVPALTLVSDPTHPSDLPFSSSARQISIDDLAADLEASRRRAAFHPVPTLRDANDTAVIVTPRP